MKRRMTKKKKKKKKKNKLTNERLKATTLQGVEARSNES